MFDTWQAWSKFKNISLTYDDICIEIVDRFKDSGVVLIYICLQVNSHMSSNIQNVLVYFVELNVIFHEVQSSAKSMVFPPFDFCSH